MTVGEIGGPKVSGTSAFSTRRGERSAAGTDDRLPRACARGFDAWDENAIDPGASRAASPHREPAPRHGAPPSPSTPLA